MVTLLEGKIMRDYHGDKDALGGVFSHTQQPQTMSMVIVSVVVTLVGLFGLILLAGITWCCCAKTKTSDSDEDNEEASGFIARKSGDGQGGGRRGDGDVSIPVEGTWGNDKNGNEKARGSVQGRHRGAETKTSEDNAISVKDRVRKFERKTPPDSDVVVNKREGAKPGKKKPRSKAFEEFESSGIIIGMGNAPRKRQSDIEWEADDNGMEEQEGRGSSFEYLPTDTSPLYPRRPGLESARFVDDEEGGSTKEDDEDLFAGVERNTEILKSFRRAPPPRKHNKPRRKPALQTVPSGELWDTPSKTTESKKSDISVTVDVSPASNSVSQPPSTQHTDHSDMHGSSEAQCGLWKMNHDHVDNHNVNDDEDEHDYVYRAEKTHRAHTTATVSHHTDRWSSSHVTNFKCPNDLTLDTSMDKVADKVLLDDGHQPLQNNVQRLSDRPQSFHYGANNEMPVKETKVFSLSHTNDISPTLTCPNPSPKSGPRENAAITSVDNTDSSADYHKWHRHRSGSEKTRQPTEGAGSSSYFNSSGADMRKWQSEHLDHHRRPLSESGSTHIWHMQQPGMHRDTSKQMAPTDQTISQSAQRSAAKRSRSSPSRQHSAPVRPSSASLKYLETEI